MQNNVTVHERIDPHKYLDNDNIRGTTKRSRLRGFREGRKPEKCKIIKDASGKLKIKRYTRENEIVITDLPEEITYLCDGRSLCTLCHCKITTIKTIMEHVAAAPHQNRLQDMRKKALKKEEHIYAMDKEKPENSADDQASHTDVENVTHKNLEQMKNNVGSSNPIKLNVTCEKDGKVSGECDPLEVFGTKNLIKPVDGEDCQGKIDVPENAEQKETKTLPNGKFHGISNGMSRELSSAASSEESGDFQSNKSLLVFPLELSNYSHLHEGNWEEFLNGIFRIEGTIRFVCLVCVNSGLFTQHAIIQHLTSKEHLDSGKELSKPPQDNTTKCFLSLENRSEGIIRIPNKHFLFCVFCEKALFNEDNLKLHVGRITHRNNKQTKILSNEKSKSEVFGTSSSLNPPQSPEINAIQYMNTDHSDNLRLKGTAKSSNEQLQEKSMTNESSSSEKFEKIEVCASLSVLEGKMDSCSVVDNQIQKLKQKAADENIDTHVMDKKKQENSADNLRPQEDVGNVTHENSEQMDNNVDSSNSIEINETCEKAGKIKHVDSENCQEKNDVFENAEPEETETLLNGEFHGTTNGISRELLSAASSEESGDVQLKELLSVSNENMDDCPVENGFGKLSKATIRLGKHFHVNEEFMDGIFRIEGTSKFVCQICDDERLLKRKNIIPHVKGERHLEFKKAPLKISHNDKIKYFLSLENQSEGIINLPNKSFLFCLFCENKFFNENSLKSHVRSLKHQYNKQAKIMKNEKLELEPSETCPSANSPESFGINTVENMNSGLHQNNMDQSEKLGSKETAESSNEHLQEKSISNESSSSEKFEKIEVRTSLSVSEEKMDFCSVDNQLQEIKQKVADESIDTHVMGKKKQENSADNLRPQEDVGNVIHKNSEQTDNNVDSSNPIGVNETCAKDGKIKHFDSDNCPGKNDVFENAELKETKTLPVTNGEFCATSNGISRELSSATNSEESGDVRLEKLSSVSNENMDYRPLDNRIGKLSTANSQLSEYSYLQEQSIKDIFKIKGTSIFVCLGCKSAKLFMENDIVQHVTGRKHLESKNSPSNIPYNDTVKYFLSLKNQSEGIISIPGKRFLCCLFCEKQFFEVNSLRGHLKNMEHRYNKRAKILSNKKVELEPFDMFPSANLPESFEINTVPRVNSGLHRNNMDPSEKLGSKETAEFFNEQLDEKSTSNESASSEKLGETEVCTSSSVSEGRMDSCSVDNEVSQSSTSELTKNLDELRKEVDELKEDIFRIDGTNVFFCIGCDVSTVFSENGIVRHLVTEFHSRRKKVLGYKTAKTYAEYDSSTDRSQGIILVPRKEFLFCKFCKCKIPRKKIAQHVRTIGHRQYVAEEMTEKFKEGELNPVEVLLPKDLSDGIEKFSNKNFLLCTKCKIKLPDESRAIEEHISTAKHKNEGIKVIFNVGKDNFECRICGALSLSGYSSVINHLKGPSHARKWRTKENQLHKFIETLKIHSDRRLKNVNLKTISIHDMTLLTVEIVTIRGISGNWCMKCNYHVDSAHVKSHRYGRQHKDALKVIQDTQDILKFHCELCNCTIIGRSNWDEHEKSDEHRRNEEELVGAEQSEVPVDESQPEVKPMISSFQLSEDDDNLEKEELIKGSPRPDAKAHPKHEQMVDCNICQCRILGGNMNISAHRDSKEHKDNEAKLFGGAKTPGNAENLVPNASASAPSFNAKIPLDAYYSYHYRDDDMIDFIECKVCDLEIRATENISANFVYASHVNSEEHKMKVRVFESNWKASTPSTSQCSESLAELSTQKRGENGPILGELPRTIPRNAEICTKCGGVFEGESQLHAHMTSHFWQRFTTRPPKIIEEAPKEPAAPVASKDTEDSDHESVMNDSPMKTSEKSHFRKKPLDIEVTGSRNIYEIDQQKMSEIKAGVLLSLPKDKNTIYCLICRCNVSRNLQTLYEHLCSVKHLNYLEDMLYDDELFENHENQLSDLALAYQYMEDISDYSVKCHACNISVNNEFSKLCEHIDSTNHIAKWRVLDDDSGELFRRLKSKMKCDFYSIRKYWCVICGMKFITECEFQKHLKQKKHLGETRKFDEEFLMFDYCGVCASLWYGFLKTFSYHSDCTMHKYHKLDGFFSIDKLPESAELLLNSPEEGIEAILRGLEFRRAIDKSKEDQLLRDLRAIAVVKYPNTVVHPFGSRITGLGGKNSDLDVFLDCPIKNKFMYFGMNSHPELIKKRLLKIKESLENNSNIWHIDREIFDCRIPIIKIKHKPTDIECDLSFTNGLTVENTALIRNYCDKSTDCRKLIIFIKNWMNHCELSGANSINSYGIAWLVIYFLQTKKILPTVNQLIEMNNKSQIIAGWETGVSKNFQVQTFDGSFGELLNEFFKFYGNFDYRHDVICPLLGEIVKKIDFQHRDKLPSAMGPYLNYLRDTSDAEPFRIDSIMCLQDPFDLAHNITKAVKKFNIYKFRTFCCYSTKFIDNNV